MPLGPRQTDKIMFVQRCRKSRFPCHLTLQPMGSRGRLALCYANSCFRVLFPGNGISRKERVGAEAVEGILNRRVAQAVDWASLKALGVLGLDEIALKKGHRDFVTIVSAQPPGGALTVDLK